MLGVETIAGCILAYPIGVAADHTHYHLCKSRVHVARLLRARGSRPENEHIERHAYRAHLSALELIVEAERRHHGPTRSRVLNPYDPALKAALDTITPLIKGLNSDKKWRDHLPKQAAAHHGRAHINTALNTLMAGEGDDRARITALEKAMIHKAEADIRAFAGDGVLPDDLADRLADPDRGYLKALSYFIADEIKQGDAAFVRIYQAGEAAATRQALAALRADLAQGVLAQIPAEVRQEFDQIKQTLGRIEADVKETKADVKDIKAMLAARHAEEKDTQALMEEMARVKAEKHLTERQMAALLADILDKPQIALDQIPYALAHAAVEWAKLKDRLSRQKNVPEMFAHYRADAKAALEDGRLDEARALLNTLVAKRADWMAEQKALMDQETWHQVDALEELAGAAFTQSDVEDGAEALLQAADLILRLDREKAGVLRYIAGVKLNEFGERFGGAVWLDKAEKAYQAALEIYIYDTIPVARARINRRLGNVLSVQGERLGGKNGFIKLEKACYFYKIAFELFNEENLTKENALTLNFLGSALYCQSEILDDNLGSEKINKAIAVLKTAFLFQDPNTRSVDGASIQNNLGICLAAQGRRLGGDEGLAKLDAAAKAYQAALQVRTRKAMPVDWARTMNNVGNALLSESKILEGQAGLNKLHMAVQVYEAALEVRTRRAMPSYWAITSTNLAEALLIWAQKYQNDSCKQRGCAILADAWPVICETFDEKARAWLLPYLEMCGLPGGGEPATD